MTKQEALKKIEKLEGLNIKDKDFNFDIEMIPKGETLEIIEQIDEPEKPVVPQFVADWIEVCKENLGFSLSSAMSHSTSAMKAQPNEVQGWFNLKDNQETFAKAWLFGYEVEKEKLYTVEFPNPNSDDHLVLRKNFDGKVCVNLLYSEYWRENESTQLTEAEIKQDFSWAWQFAKEVEE